jgi:hypothetical protein
MIYYYYALAGIPLNLVLPYHSRVVITLLKPYYLYYTKVYYLPNKQDYSYDKRLNLYYAYYASLNKAYITISFNPSLTLLYYEL